MLNAQQVTEFEEQGFVVIPDFLSADEVSSYLGQIEQISRGQTLASHDDKRMEMEPDQPPDGTRIRRIYEPCTYYDDFRALSESDRLLDVVEQLLGPNLLYHYSKLNMKPPQIGSVVEWHQDLTYFPLTSPDSVAVLCYLDDADQDNGCLQMLPGRHKQSVMDHTSDGYFQGHVTQTLDDAGAVPVAGRAGTVIFMHCLTPHASVTNRSTRHRRTLIMGYRAADAFPIYCGQMTINIEQYVRLVRGQGANTARLEMDSFPIPRYPRQIASLYDLQEQSRKLR